jgi:hypothetical protein
MELLSGTSGTSIIDMGDTSDADIGGIRYENTNNAMLFRANNDERMRIDSSGNLLVGKSSTAGNVVGTEIRSNGRIQLSADGDDALRLNRKNSDGPIQLFQKDGSTVGSVVYSSATNIALGNASKGIGIGTGSVFPTNGSTAISDAGLDLGYSSSRFKDLYLSGGAYIGGTGSSNHLDDYEEGTFTPIFTTSGGGESVTYDTQVGKYTKVGDRVMFSVFLGTDAFTGGSSALGVDGFPFTFASGDNISGHIGLAYSFASTLDAALWIGIGNSTRIDLYKQDNLANFWTTTVVASGSNSNRLYFSGHYRTTS